MVALAGFSGLFCGCLITFFAWKIYFDMYSKKASRIIKALKKQLDMARDTRDYYKLRNYFQRNKVDVTYRHEYAMPEHVNDLKFGG